MRVDIVMPQMGESITEGTLIKWHKKKGEKVQKDEIIYEISTDKVDTEIPSPEDGVLIDIKVFEQDTVKVGTVVAVLETNGESISQKDKALSEVEADSPSVVEAPSTTQVGGGIVDVPMPKMGESVMEGTIVKWHKKVGDKVNLDEIILEISTDKVDTEVPSPVEGTIVEILHQENDTVGVGKAIAKIRASTGLMKQSKAGQVYEQEFTRRSFNEGGQEPEIEPSTFKPSNLQQSYMQHANLQPATINKFFSPLVLNIAQKEGISVSELETIPGTGINGRVTKNDILDYIKEGKRSGATFEKATLGKEELAENKTGIKFKPGERVQVIPMDNIRQRIMHHMIESRDTSVHVTAVVEVDMTKIHNFIEANRAAFENEGIKLTYMPFISFAVIRGLKEFPLMNASLEGSNIIAKKYINLGIAVAVEPNGLIVPNIKNADEKNIRGLAKAIADIGSRARNKKLVPDDVVDGTFSITNYGVFGSLFGTPIINQPEVGILGVGAVTKKPVVIENNGIESIAIKPMMYLSLSHDHRLVDGMLGGKFLKSIKNILENFDTALI